MVWVDDVCMPDRGGTKQSKIKKRDKLVGGLLQILALSGQIS